LVAGVAGGVTRFLDFDDGWVIAAMLLILSTVAWVALSWVRQPTLVQVALEVDRRLGLHERVTTALELVYAAQPPAGSTHDVRNFAATSPLSAEFGTSSLAEQQIADALKFLTPDATSPVFPLSATRRTLSLAVIGLVLAGLPWVAAWPVLIRSYLPPSPVQLVAQAEADRLDSVARRLDSDNTSTDRATRAQLVAQLRKAADALRQSGGNAQQATRDIQNAEQATMAAAPQTSEDASKTLARIADALNSNSLTQSATGALDNQNPAAAAADMAQLASGVAGMSPQERDDLANALQSASSAARSSDTNAADQFQQAADAARNGDPAGVQQAAQTLQQLGDTSQAQRDVAQTRSELQASQEALAQAGQKSGQASNGTQSASNPSVRGSGSNPSNGNPQEASTGTDAGSPGSNPNGATGNNSQANSAGDPAGGIGTGSTDHLGAPQDIQGLAQRQVDVPANSNGDPGSIGPSNQRQTGVGGTAQVDYVNVLPEYRTQALQTIEGNVVPSDLKQVVKGYFDSLAPN
jgi:hypothetical protein